MSNLKISVAQIASIKGNVDENLSIHLKAIEKASELGVSYIVFPELSLTGYEPELAKHLAFSIDDKRLQPLIDSAVRNNINIGVGAPLMSDGLPKIGLIIVSQSGAINTYEKMHLHPGEEDYFDKGECHNVVTISSTNIANGICADANNASHVQACSDLGAEVYIAGVLITEAGYDSDTAVMAEYANQYNMLVAMANHNQPTGKWAPIGKSAIWSNEGLLACASEYQNALVVAEKMNTKWFGQVVEI
ncbi:carbon-nitrogen hydrolase family protein [Alteromonas sp. 5E99-2]|uniref:carbon-nitrogen hydrolase family protein n=1 Tax=Alteromonas sp. 5E99-2 TaxID=2817683 RepID=UPI001A98980D|nr:carbon-nitrogen hydrolase family protein [Alteromonas sp. 5E99-2]MBO1256253.1 carbon-nitrogen hydrolase family protein [Alteromonas sp. 5E99-2]